MSDGLTVLTDLSGQVGKLPFVGLLMGVILVVGVLLKKLKLFPNKYIPAVTLIMGTVGYAFLGDPGKIDHAQSHPRVILGFYGTLIGFATWAAHRWLLKRLEKFLPEGFFPEGCWETDPPFPKEDGSNVKPQEERK